MTADLGRSSDWPDGLTDQLARFSQGHVVNDVPLFFANLGAAELWGHPRHLIGGGPPEIAVEPGRILHRAMILTQGCDIVRKNTPWVTLAPVYEASTRLSPGQVSGARAGNTLHLVPLTAAWTHGETWFVDLRLELPVEKSVLLDREPLESFADEVDYRRLSERLAARRQRPDLPDDVLTHVVEPLFDAVRGESDGGAAMYEGVYEVRVQCNDALSPSVVTIFVLAKDGEEPDESGWARIIGTIYEAAQDNGLTVVGPEVCGLDELTARDHLTSASITDRSSS